LLSRRQVLLIGASMGATGTLMFAHLASAVLAFNPMVTQSVHPNQARVVEISRFTLPDCKGESGEGQPHHVALRV
jgi:N-acyl-L-homoserine lactone synthetase